MFFILEQFFSEIIIEKSLAILKKMVYNTQVNAGVLELVDEVDSKSTGGNTVPVRARPPAPEKAPFGVLFQLSLPLRASEVAFGSEVTP